MDEFTKEKWTLLRRIKDDLMAKGYTFADVDELKPWGAYLRVVDEQAEQFLKDYFPGIGIDDVLLVPGASLSPKILIFAPGKQISWQFHERRGEFWRVLEGSVDMYVSENDQQPAEPQVIPAGNTIQYAPLMRHRGGGHGSEWAVVAEIWQHSDANNPTNEADNIRLADDFGRA